MAELKRLSREKFLVLIGLVLGTLTGSNVASAGIVSSPTASALLDSIPGARSLASWSDALIDTLSSAVEEGVGAFNDEIQAATRNDPDAQALNEGLDDVQSFAGAEKDLDAKRNVCEIIRSRGFAAEEYDVTTKDGYILTVQRIINPLVEPSHRAKLKPVILQHGLMSSSVDWVINSCDVKPAKYPPAAAGTTQTNTDDNDDDDDDENMLNSIGAHQRQTASKSNGRLPVARAARRKTAAGRRSKLTDDSQEHPNSLGFYLANEGYDVFLANSRGNIYGQRHTKLSSWNPKFWDFTFDEQIKYDLPNIIEFIQQLTNHTKLAYVGHSQGTTMIFGLLSDRPEFADIVEPVVALAPVAYVSNCLSPVRHFATITPLFQHVNMWFASSNVAVRYLGPIVCGPQVIRRDICANIIFLSTGFDEAEFNMTRVTAYLAHMPSGTSIKNIAHWGQMVNSGRFAHFDHGILANKLAYGQSQAPDYDLAKIKSKSISLFTAENDWLAAPLDVARLKGALKVPLFRVVNVTEDKPKWNHIDFVYAKDAGQLVNKRIIDIFSHFR